MRCPPRDGALAASLTPLLPLPPRSDLPSPGSFALCLASFGPPARLRCPASVWGPCWPGPRPPAGRSRIGGLDVALGATPDRGSRGSGGSAGSGGSRGIVVSGGGPFATSGRPSCPRRHGGSRSRGLGVPSLSPPLRVASRLRGGTGPTPSAQSSRRAAPLGPGAAGCPCMGRPPLRCRRVGAQGLGMGRGRGPGPAGPGRGAWGEGQGLPGWGMGRGWQGRGRWVCLW